MYTVVIAPEWPCRVKRQHESSRRNTWAGMGVRPGGLTGHRSPSLVQGTSSLPEQLPIPCARPPSTGDRATLTLSVWSWLPVTRRPAAAFRAVIGFWCAQGTVWVRWQATVSLLLYTGDVGELPRPGFPGESRPVRGL